MQPGKPLNIFIGNHPSFEQRRSAWSNQSQSVSSTTLPSTWVVLFSFPLIFSLREDLSLTSKVKSKPPSAGGDELAWLHELQSLWLKQITQVDHSLDEGQPDRARMWYYFTKSNFFLFAKGRPTSRSCTTAQRYMLRR